jgi:hypothetical protein
MLSLIKSTTLKKFTTGFDYFPLEKDFSPLEKFQLFDDARIIKSEKKKLW